MRGHKTYLHTWVTPTPIWDITKIKSLTKLLGITISVTRFDNLLDFGQLFITFGNN